MTIPGAVHLKYLDRGEFWVPKKAFNLQVSTEVSQLGIEGDSPYVGDDAAVHGCLHSTDITEERTSVGGGHMVQEPRYCEEYYEQKSSRKGLLDTLKR